MRALASYYIRTHEPIPIPHPFSWLPAKDSAAKGRKSCCRGPVKRKMLTVVVLPNPVSDLHATLDQVSSPARNPVQDPACTSLVGAVSPESRGKRYEFPTDQWPDLFTLLKYLVTV